MDERIFKQKLRVCSYSRVSTTMDEQLNSLENQKQFFNEYIEKNPNWTYVNMFYDLGISGLNVNKRDGFINMIEEAKEGKFDLIITKEVSRFSRNISDVIFYTRELKKYNVYVLFLNDGICTKDADSELMLGIMASLSQQESLKISSRVSFGIFKSMENGVVFGSSIYGYYIKDGKITGINEHEAEAIRLIFKLYLQGYGARVIANRLEEKGYKSPKGNKVFSTRTILRLLRNEKYCGMLVQRKTKTVDIFTKQRIMNPNEDEYIIIDNNHIPIVSKEDFYAVQKEMARRNNIHCKENGRYSGKYPYSRKVICGKCGKTYKHVYWSTDKNGNKKYGWRCSNKSHNGKHVRDDIGCDNSDIPDYLLNGIMYKTILELFVNKDDEIDNICNIIEQSITIEKDDIDFTKINKELETISNKRDKLLDAMLDGIITKNEYAIKKEELDELYNSKVVLLEKYNNKEDKIEELKIRLNKLKNIVYDISNFNENNIPIEIITLILDKIVVYDRNNFEVYLNTDFSFNVFYDEFNKDVDTHLVDIIRYRGIQSDKVLIHELTIALSDVSNIYSSIKNNGVVNIKVYMLI